MTQKYVCTHTRTNTHTNARSYFVGLGLFELSTYSRGGGGGGGTTTTKRPSLDGSQPQKIRNTTAYRVAATSAS